MNFAIAILNWNGKALLERYLPSVCANSTDAHIYVIDNASTDDSVAWVQTHFPEVTCLVLPENYGYAGGYNLGLQQIKEEYYVLLNSDVEVTPDWLSPIRSFLASNPNCEMLQPKIRADRQRTHFEYAGASGGFIDAYGYPYCRGRLFTTLEEDYGQYDEAVEIHWATGACLVVKATTFHALGGFDTSFFAHMEEIDLAWRYRNTGKSIYVVPQSVVYHLGGATLSATNPQKTYLNFRNSLSMLYKNLPKNKIFGIIFVRLVLDGVAGVQLVFQGKPLHCWAIVRAHFAFYARIPSLNKKRASTALTHYYHRKSVVWDYFIQKKRFFSDLF